MPDPLPGQQAPMPEQEIDLLVIGAGAAGMTAALVGAIEGLRTVLCEKTGMVGGTTSTSAGTVWIPGSHQSEQAGIPDSIEDAKTYLNAVIGPSGGNAGRAAFLNTGPTMLDYLEAHTNSFPRRRIRIIRIGPARRSAVARWARLPSTAAGWATTSRAFVRRARNSWCSAA